MSSVNKAILMGHVGKDPDVRNLEGGKVVATFSLATTERGYTLQNGTVVPDRTEWHNLVVWDGLAKVVQQYVKKGSLLYVEGKIRTRNYEKDGNKKYITEVFVSELQMLPSKSDQPAQQPMQQPVQPAPQMQQPMQPMQPMQQGYQQPMQQGYSQGYQIPYPSSNEPPF